MKNCNKLQIAGMIFTIILSIPFLAGWCWNKPITNPEVAINDKDGKVYIIDTNNRIRRVRIKNRGFDVSLSPDGTKIAYNDYIRRISDTEAIYGLWVCNIDGTDQRLISNRGGKGALPRLIAWSPDSKRIAFKADYDKGGGIYLVESSGKNEKFLMKAGLLGWVDNRTVVCGKDRKILLLDVITLKTKDKIVHKISSDEERLSYSGDKIVYMEHIEKIREGSRFYRTVKNIYISGINGENKKLLAKERISEKPKPQLFSFSNLKWGRSGKKIFYNAKPLVLREQGYKSDTRGWRFTSFYYFLMCIEIDDNNNITNKTKLKEIRYTRF
ncbi:MAG: hypothetical protein ABIK53_06825 [bacterium]